MTEQAIQKQILKALPLHKNVAWLERINVGKVFIGKRFVTFGFKGCSDLVGQMKDGRFLAIEVKKPRGKTTKEQRKFIELVQTNGGVSGIARSIDDALEIVK